jgi:hypothetical protein
MSPCLSNRTLRCNVQYPINAHERWHRDSLSTGDDHKPHFRSALMHLIGAFATIDLIKTQTFPLTGISRLPKRNGLRAG